jgi:hypothetical protein
MSCKCETSQAAATLSARSVPERAYNVVDVKALAREHSAIEANLRTVIVLATTALPLPTNNIDYNAVGQLVLDMHDALDRASGHVLAYFTLSEKSEGCA